MELFLVRHAQSLNNARPQRERIPDPPLTDVGHRQCDFLAERIRSLQLSRLFCSPFLRTLQTAEHICRAADISVEVRTVLHEQGGCISGWNLDTYVGRPGMNHVEIRARFPDFHVSPEIDSEGWWGSKPFEVEQVARRRAAQLYAQTIEEFASTSDRVAYVMHGEFKRLLLSEIGQPPDVVAFNAAITKISIEPTGHQLERYNCVEHLPEELITH